jgi:hypothetical protein
VHWLVDDFDEALQIWKAMEDLQRQVRASILCCGFSISWI